MPLLHEAEVAVVDTETTGFSPDQRHALVEVAVVRLCRGEVASEWSSLMNPGREIPKDASQVHGILDRDVSEAPGPAEVARRLREECADRVLAFHNAPFDLPFLAALLREQGQPPLTAPVIDTLGLARGAFGPGGNSLVPLAHRLGVEVGTEHRALGDARTTARVLAALAARWEREGRARSLTELAALSQDQVRMARPAGGGGR